MKKKKKDSSIKHKVIRDIRTLFKPDEEDYYELIRINNVFDDNFIECESDVDKDKTLLIEEYLDKIRSYLNNMINAVKIQGECTFQIKISKYFIPFCLTSEIIHPR